MKKHYLALLTIIPLLLSGCAFTDAAYKEERRQNNNSNNYSETATSDGSTSVNTLYKDVPTKKYYSSFPNYRNPYANMAYSLDDLNYLLSAAITMHESSVTINCPFDHNLSLGDFLVNYLDNSHLVNITCDQSYLSGHASYLSTYTFNLEYLSHPNYTSTKSGTHPNNARNLNYEIKKDKINSTRSTFPIDSKSSIDVYDSEGLWWSVQNGFSPNCQNIHTSNLYQKAREIVADVVDLYESDAYQISKAIYDYLVMECVYDYDALYDYSSGNTIYKNTAYAIEGVFNYNRAVCDGLAKAYVLLTGIAGVHSVRAFGYPLDSNTGHAWNYVNLDNDYYLVCSTWGRSDRTIPGTTNSYSLVDYEAFLTKSSYFSDRGSNFYQYNTNIFSNSVLNESITERDVIINDCNYSIDSETELTEVLLKANAYGLNNSYLIMQSGENYNLSASLVEKTAKKLFTDYVYSISMFTGRDANNNELKYFYFYSK